MTAEPAAQPDRDAVLRLTGAYDHLATKADLADLRTEVHQGLANLRGEVHQGLADQRAEMHKTIGDLKADLIKWMISLMLATAAVAASAVIAIDRLLGS